ncbi:MAG TPA: DUF1566 domain-containing protein [Polyangiaceae bacterium]
MTQSMLASLWAPSCSETTSIGWVVLLLGALSCQGNKQAPLPLDADQAPAVVQAWATWPMPNSTPGLPNPQSFDTHDANVVTDRVTGLMWERNVDEHQTPLVDAEQRCAHLAVSGHQDWRLPSRIELVSILNLARTQPAIDVNAFPQTPSDWFWTSSMAAGNGQSAWYVYFYFGYPKTDLTTNQFSSRCVRTAESRPAATPRYDIQSDTVRDVGTGLVWQRSVPNRTFSSSDARAYCAGLNLADHQGWRLPSMVELLTLIDENAATPPMIDGTAFPNTPSEPFWSGTDFGGAPGMAWQVYFDRGNGLYGLPNAMFRVRCVQ